MKRSLRVRLVKVTAFFEGFREPKRGTGFRVGPGKTLTCQHVVEHQADGKTFQANKIQLSWMAEDAKEPVLDDSARVIWRGEETLDRDELQALDVVILEDSLPAGDLEEFSGWVRNNPTQRGRWKSAGFAVLSTSTVKLHHGDGITGRFDSVTSDDSPVIPLTLEGEAPKNEKGESSWGGISGSPVVIADGVDSEKLLGLIRRHPESNSDRLYAVSIPALLRRPEFAQHADCPKQGAPNPKLFEATCRHLDELSLLRRSLGKLVNAEESPSEKVLQALFERGTIQTVIAALQDLSAQMDPSLLREAAVCLVTLLALPELERRGLARQEVTDNRAVLAINSRNYAELSQAGVDGRPGEYRKQEGDLPARPWELPLLKMESGALLEKRAKTHVQEWSARLIEGVPESCMPFQTELDMIEDYPEDQQFNQLIKWVNLNLGKVKKEKNGRFYFFVTPKLRQALKVDLEEFLKYLAELAPNIVQLELQPGGNVSMELEAQLRPLWRILGLWSEPGGDS